MSKYFYLTFFKNIFTHVVAYGSHFITSVAHCCSTLDAGHVICYLFSCSRIVGALPIISCGKESCIASSLDMLSFLLSEYLVKELFCQHKDLIF